MTTTGTPPTDTTAWPVYATKAACQADIEELLQRKDLNKNRLKEIQFRLSNTDTDNWTAASTSRHDD